MRKRRYPYYYRMTLWPIRFSYRQTPRTFLMMGKIYAGHARDGANLYGWILGIGPLKIVTGRMRDNADVWLRARKRQR